MSDTLTDDRAAPDAAQWSKELPKKSGWYFMRNEGEEPIADGLVVWVGYNASGIRHEGKFFYADDGFLKRREFLGPITMSIFNNSDAVRQARRETVVCDCHWSSVQEMHDDYVKLEAQMNQWKQANDLPHSCVPIARAVAMDEGRDWWIGRLTELIAEWPKETHCLHMKTPVKSVVFLCNSGDFEQLLVMSNVVTKLKNLQWLDSMTEAAALRAEGKGDSNEDL